MKHVTIVLGDSMKEPDKVIATITSNNFGDQLIQYRQYGLCYVDKNGYTFYGYRDLYHVTNPETEHWDNTQIVNYYLNNEEN